MFIRYSVLGCWSDSVGHVKRFAWIRNGQRPLSFSYATNETEHDNVDEDERRRRRNANGSPAIS